MHTYYAVYTERNALFFPAGKCVQVSFWDEEKIVHGAHEIPCNPRMGWNEKENVALMSTTVQITVQMHNWNFSYECENIRNGKTRTFI